VLKGDGQQAGETFGSDRNIRRGSIDEFNGAEPAGTFSLGSHPDAPGWLILSYGPIEVPPEGAPISFCMNVSRACGDDAT
jgi:hypothetical protein